MNRVLAQRSVIDRYVFAVLITLELLMSFSFLGYFHVEPISVTTAYLPVLLAGALLGPLESAAVGLCFGLASMWKASASYVMPADQLFSPLLSGDPMGSLLLSTGSRVLFGLIIGLLYAGARRLRHPGFWIGLVSYWGRSIHSILVYSVMALCFPETGYSPTLAFTDLFQVSDILINCGSAAVVLLFWRIARSQVWVQFQKRLAAARSLQAKERYHRLPLAVVTVLTLAAAFAVTFYFGHRIDYVLENQGIALSETGYLDILHLQIQFMFGIISLMVLMILFMMLNQQYSSYMAYEGKMDSLTGVMTRRAFFAACARAFHSAVPPKDLRGYFLMVDLDQFKEINDQYGHPEGDRALKAVANSLKDLFGRQGAIGRLGGDEFAVLLCADMTVSELEAALDLFLDHIHRISWGNQRLTCSIGAALIRSASSPEALYRAADAILYRAKDQGRDRYVIET